jgi:hypothetical protein
VTAPDGAAVGPALPVGPEPLTDGGGHLLVVPTRVLVGDRPSATLLAAQQLSDDADRHPHRLRRAGAPAADRNRRRQRAVLAERRADRAGGSAR